MFFNFHTHKAENESIVNLFAQDSYPENDNLIYSVGIHPWHLTQLHLPSVLEILKVKAGKKYVVAIGECGFDIHAEADKITQLQMFEQHILIAERVRKPLILHWVKGWDILEKRLKEGIRVPIAIHGFQAKKEIAQYLIKNQVYMSFGSALLRRDSAIQDYFRNLPPSLILLETDDDNISIEAVYKQAASLLSIDITDLQEQIRTNIQTFLNKNRI